MQAGDAEELAVALEDAGSSLSDLSFVSIHSVGRQPDDVEEALAGRFRIGAKRFLLESPVDWADRPYAESDAEAFFLNSLVFADPLLAQPLRGEVIPPLVRVFIDWLDANPLSGVGDEHRYAWHDHAAAGRLVYLSFALREGVRLGLLDRGEARRLASGVLEHVEFLLDEGNYAGNYNHGLFSDAALAIAARSLEAFGPSRAWADKATSRFQVVLEGTVDTEDALHLEHSPYYHWIIHGAISRFSAAGLFEELGLSSLARRMEESGSWLVAPDGTLPPIGDTPFNREPPAEVKRAAATRSGLRLFKKAGYAVVRDGDSVLIATAAFHPTAHKHCDDGSFCLYEEGRPVVLDTGDPGHDYAGADRRYGTSPAAHATISIDGHDWVRDGGSPYGSGVVAGDEAEGIYAVLLVNPIATPAGGSRRLLVYSPSRFLAAIDLLDAPAKADAAFRRYLPLAADIDAKLNVGGEVILGRDSVEIARVVGVSAIDSAGDGVEFVRGRGGAQPDGLYYPVPGEGRPRTSIAFCGSAGDSRALVVGLERGILDSPGLVCSLAGQVAEVELSGVGEAPIRLRADQGAISLIR